MNELIKLSPQKINGDVKETVNARELYEKLGLDKSHWARWSKLNIAENPFALESVDYMGFTIKANGNETVNYALTVDFAKKLAMQVKTPQGEAVRDYFIECEKALRVNAPKTYIEALEAHLKSEKEKLLLQDELTVTHQRKKQISGKLGGTTKELNKVKTLNGASKNGATINKVKSATGIKYKWQPLQAWCDENDVIPIQTMINDYDTVTVKIYPAQAWYEIYDIELCKLFS